MNGNPVPSQVGFTAWVRTAMGISTTVLPDDSVWLTYAYDQAIAVVNTALCAAPGATYMLAVYNLGGDNLINYAQDLPDAAGYMAISADGSKLPFFAYFRAKWGISDFLAGVVQSSSDESTSQSLVVQKAAEAFQLSDLQNLKTPWGRTYLGFAQKYGPSVWGVA